ncbi:uncharacterized protein LODBEIA_P01580 [Lodderomyces beijingensis]|uniref:Mitochondrial morphogenesis protein SLD7 n=1 Tax=Lodderomyces beijingensis TaxID=1775926 RepID=A0ABP0ZCN0_9ASCO
MNHHFSAQVEDGGKVYDDVQFWSGVAEKVTPFAKKLTFIAYVFYSRIPIYLISSPLFTVYTGESATEGYFESKLVGRRESDSGQRLGLLTKIYSEGEEDDDDGVYVVFYHDKDVRSFVLDFSLLEPFEKLTAGTSTTSNAFVVYTETAPSQTPSKIFDKVLQKKKLQEPAPSTADGEKQSVSRPLSTPDQINRAVNKIILSGLRLRGLTLNQAASVNAKLKIKEIYQMTFKATLFSLRKYSTNIGKNGELERREIRITDLQETVEGLLHLFVDVE